MTSVEKTKLFTLLGDYPNTLALKQAKVRSKLIEFEFADVKAANTAFKPLVRDHKFDLAELAIVTFLQAKAFDKPYVLMPAPVVVRSQHHTLAYNAEREKLTPEGLANKRVGVRAYSVTTGVWVRGILQEQYGLDLSKVRWVTFDEPHVAEYTDPNFVDRAPPDKNMVQMLLDGELDAAVIGDKMPDARLRKLIPDSETAAHAWAQRHGDPINHMMVVRSEISQKQPDTVAEAFGLLKECRDIAVRDGDKTASQLNFGVEANRRPLETIIDIAYRQKLIPRRYDVDELFDDTTRTLM